MATHVHPYEGGGFPFCPDAENGDGLIDLCIVNGLGLPRIFPLIPLAKFGMHKGCKGVILTKCKKARIQVDTPVSFHTDGEVHEDQTELTYMSNEYGYRLQVK
jgi:diacylglycerol kinase family enzyme